MADTRYHVASISCQFRGLIYWNAHASSSFDHSHWAYNSVFKQIRRCSLDGRKRCENDKCGRISFWKRSKRAPFSFENGLVWTGPQSSKLKITFRGIILNWISWCSGVEDRLVGESYVKGKWFETWWGTRIKGKNAWQAWAIWRKEKEKMELEDEENRRKEKQFWAHT